MPRAADQHSALYGGSAVVPKKICHGICGSSDVRHLPHRFVNGRSFSASGFSMKGGSSLSGRTMRASEREAARSVSSFGFALLAEDNRPASACHASARPRAAGETSPTPANPRSSLAPLLAPPRQVNRKQPLRLPSAARFGRFGWFSFRCGGQACYAIIPNMQGNVVRFPRLILPGSWFVKG